MSRLAFCVVFLVIFSVAVVAFPRFVRGVPSKKCTCVHIYVNGGDALPRFAKPPSVQRLRRRRAQRSRPAVRRTRACTSCHGDAFMWPASIAAARFRTSVSHSGLRAGQASGCSASHIASRSCNRSAGLSARDASMISGNVVRGIALASLSIDQLIHLASRLQPRNVACLGMLVNVA